MVMAMLRMRLRAPYYLPSPTPSSSGDWERGGTESDSMDSEDRERAFDAEVRWREGSDSGGSDSGGSDSDPDWVDGGSDSDSD